MELKCLADILTQSRDLSRFTKQIDQLSKINQAVKNHLDPNLAPYCQVANLRDGILIITTHSSTWGHQLRFQEMELLSTLRSTPEWCGLKSIQCRVVPKAPTRYPQNPPSLKNALPRPRLSPKSAAHLQESAHHIVHPGLKQALLKIPPLVSSL